MVVVFRSSTCLRGCCFVLLLSGSLRERPLGSFRLLRGARELSGRTRRRQDGRTCRSIISMRLFCHPSFAEPKVLIPVRLRLVVALRRVNGPETSLDVSSRQYAKPAGKGIRPVLDLHPSALREERRSSSTNSGDFFWESRGDFALKNKK